jgi:hypothetical protein
MQFDSIIFIQFPDCEMHISFNCYKMKRDVSHVHLLSVHLYMKMQFCKTKNTIFMLNSISYYIFVLNFQVYYGLKFLKLQINFHFHKLFNLHKNEPSPSLTLMDINFFDFFFYYNQ